MTLKLLVETTNLETGAKTRKYINHDDHGDRKWLGKHCFWAFRNAHSVLTLPVDGSNSETQLPDFIAKNRHEA